MNLLAIAWFYSYVLTIQGESIPSCPRNTAHSTALCRDIQKDAWDGKGKLIQRISGRVVIEYATLKLDPSAVVDFSYGGTLLVRRDPNKRGIKRNKTMELDRRARLVCSYGNMMSKPGESCTVRILSRSIHLKQQANIFLGRAFLEFRKGSKTVLEEKALISMNDNSSAIIAGSFHMPFKGLQPRINVGYGATMELSGKYAIISGWLDLGRFAKFKIDRYCWIDLERGSKLKLEPNTKLELENVLERRHAFKVYVEYVELLYDQPIGPENTTLYLIPDHELIADGQEDVRTQWKYMTYLQCMESYIHYLDQMTGFTYSYDETTEIGVCKIGSNGIITGRRPPLPTGKSMLLSAINREEYEMQETHCVPIHARMLFRIHSSGSRRPLIKVYTGIDPFSMTVDRQTIMYYEFIPKNGRFFIVLHYGNKGEKLALTPTGNSSVEFKALNYSRWEQTWKLVGLMEECRIIAWNQQCVENGHRGLQLSSDACEGSQGSWTLQPTRSGVKGFYKSAGIELGYRSSFLIEGRGLVTIRGAKIVIANNSHLIIDTKGIRIGYRHHREKTQIQHVVQRIEMDEGCRMILTTGIFEGLYKLSEHSRLEIVAGKAEIRESKFYLKGRSVLAFSGRSIILYDSHLYLDGESRFICRAEYLYVTHCRIVLEQDGMISCNEIATGEIYFFGRLYIPYNTELAFEGNADFRPLLASEYQGNDEKGGEFADYSSENEPGHRGSNSRDMKGNETEEAQMSCCPQKWTKITEHWCLYMPIMTMDIEDWEKEMICYQMNGYWGFLNSEVPIEKFRAAVKTHLSFTMPVNGSEVKACSRHTHNENASAPEIDVVRIDFDRQFSRVRDKFTRLKIVFQDKAHLHGKISVVGEHWSLQLCQITFKSPVFIFNKGHFIIDLSELMTQHYPVPETVWLDESAEKNLHEMVEAWKGMDKHGRYG